MTAPTFFSVILCAHNPRPDYLARTLAALQAQSLPPTAWELILVDNASSAPLAPNIDLRWHPSGHVIEEPQLGLTASRLRGIAAARGDILVWVDDDNVLAPDYLDGVADIAREFPMLGAWGCGHFTPEWETPPQGELAPFLAYLAVHQAPRDRWSNRLFEYEATPAGAGLCVRAGVARKYASLVRGDPRRLHLGRTGTGLGACEDFDLAFTAIDAGLGTGVFCRLRLTHLMPAARVQPEYLERLVEGHAYSSTLVHAWRGAAAPPPAGLIARIREWRLRRALTAVERRLHDARRRGEARAWDILAGAIAAGPHSPGANFAPPFPPRK